MEENITYEDLKNFKYGDEIIIKDPLMGEGTVYGLFSIAEGKYYFSSDYGATLVIAEQKTIDVWCIRKINDDHPKWDNILSQRGKEIGEMLEQLEVGGFNLINELKQ